MKKLLALILAAVMILGAIACSQPAAQTEAPKAEEAAAAEAPKAEEPAAEAPKAEEPKAEEPKAEEPAAEEGPKATDGTWVCASDATHFALVKLKEDGTFYARGLMGQQGYFGKYEIVDQAVEYYDAGSDGVLKQEDMPFDVKKSEKAVKFLHEDGTPFEVRKEPETVKIDGTPTPVDPLNAELGKEYVALDNEMLHFVCFDDYSRSLTHKPNEQFTEADEIRNLLYKFMVAEVSEENAAAGWKQHELTLDLYHNGYVDMATAEEMADEAYQKIEGNVYTLADGATVTVDPDAYTAVYQKGDVVINFVKYAEPGSNEEAAVVARYEGEAFSGKVKLAAEMYDNGAIVIIANDKEIAKGTYEGQGLPTITLDKGTAEIKATSAEDVKLVYTADLGDGNVTAYELPKVAAEAAEAEAPAGPAAVAHFEGEAFGGMVKLFADMYDDKTVVFTAAKGEDAPVELTKGTYEGEGLPAFTLEKGSAEMKATSAEDVRIILTIDIGTGSEAEYELVKTALEAPAEAEAAPEAAVVAHFEGEAFSGMVKLFADMYDDKTVVFTAAKGEDAPVELTKGTYEGEGLPAFTLEKGSAEMKATSAEDVKIILTIDIGTGSEAEYELAKVS